MAESFDAVYYSQPIPSSPRVMTVLALIFDRIHFPAVHIPSDGFDRRALEKELIRIRDAPGSWTPERVQLFNCLAFTLEKQHVDEFCIFTGSNEKSFPALEPEAEMLALVLESEVFGPPPPGFQPTLSSGHVKGLEGGDEAIRYPGWLHYPANAFIYAKKQGLPLVNDAPDLPVPGLGGVDAKHNAKLLATILAIEAIQLALPSVPQLVMADLAEFRSKTREAIGPFRMAMYKFAGRLSGAISPEMKAGEVQERARFLAQTEIMPALAEARRAVEASAKPWYGRAIRRTLLTSTLAASISQFPASSAIVTALAAIATELVTTRDEQRGATEAKSRSDLYYLLRIQDELK